LAGSLTGFLRALKHRRRRPQHILRYPARRREALLVAAGDQVGQRGSRAKALNISSQAGISGTMSLIAIE